MLQLVNTGRQSIHSYSEIVGKEAINDLKRLAKPLHNLRVLNINATPYGGGVSELLRSVVPLENDLGLKVEWRIIAGDEQFFKVTKEIHDALQGGHNYLNRQHDRETYLNYNFINSHEIDPDNYDIIIVHDPQPAALLDCCRSRGKAKWIWRCHIDTSQPNMEVWEYIRNFVAIYDKAIFTMAKFVPPDFSQPEVAIIPPAIDPLSPKNMALSHKMARNLLSWLGIFPHEIFITQVSRFDKWKDPMGVIKAYRLVKKEMPDIHLALVGSMALDDPSSWATYSKLTVEDRVDPNFHLFTNLTGVSNVEVNAFQRLSKIIVQKSIREGFGLVVSEALWKETPVVAGNAGGIPMQLKGGGGFLIDTIEECADKILRLMKNEDEAHALGVAGKKYIRENFLITRLIKDELELFKSLL
ncbi:MAG TPA: glycosyltransferase [Actinobacteria bacterium]|nr:glycosyltransferase [Actinomycetes bacterium]HEX21310.1 glycosyltransferase [Actinomycetota bacterium]